MAGHVVASGSGRVLMDRHDDPTHDYVLGLTGKLRPRVLFVPTATGDQRDYIVSFYETFHADRCVPHHLRLFERRVSDLAAWVATFDVIHVGGGSTVNLLDVWRRHGLDEILRGLWTERDDLVLTGGSAGGLCWFEGGTTDSWGPPLRVLADGLGLLAGSFCPHYDADGERRPLYHQALLDGVLPAGHAVGDLESLHFCDGRLVRAIGPAGSSVACTVEAVDGEVVETPLEITVL